MRSTDLGISFFTTLTVAANLATLTIAGLALAARLSRRASAPPRRLWSQLRAELTSGGLAVAWLVAAVSTGGSLWFSEGAGFDPCQLCWVQRGFMYPLVLVLAVAAWSRARLTRWPAGAGAGGAPDDDAGSGDPTGRGTGLAVLAGAARALTLLLASAGGVVSAYHVLVERFPSLETVSCDPDVPCSLVWFERLGFVTLPYMALSGFVLIVALTGAAGRARPPHPHPEEASS